MRTSDIYLFGPAFLLGAIGWGAVWLSAWSDRKYRESQREGHPAE